MLKHRYVLVAIALAAAEMAFSQGYGGPSMLSRGGNRPGHRGRSPMDLTAYGAVRGTLETGLTPVRLGEDGALGSDRRYGVQADIGAYGAHNWRKTSLGLDYRGDYRKTAQLGGYQGINQALSLDLTHTPNNRVTLFFRETGGTTNRAFGGFTAPSIPDPNSFNLANNEVFDSRLYFSQTSAGASYQKTARLSFTAMGDYFFAKRPDRRLVGVSGYRGSGGTQYRFSSRSAMTFDYQLVTFEFPRVYGDSRMHGGTVSFQRRMTRNLDINLGGGALYLRASGTQTVELSPEVAAILGRSTGVAAFTRTSVIPQISAMVNYTLERSRFTGSYWTGVVPGNGVFLTSQMDALSAGYSFSGVRKLSIGASARYTNIKSKAVQLGNLRMLGAGGGLNYAFTRMFSLSSQIDYRTFDTPGLQGREGMIVSFGISVSPARIPLSMW
jgi:hypothetical protein